MVQIIRAMNIIVKTLCQLAKNQLQFGQLCLIIIPSLRIFFIDPILFIKLLFFIKNARKNNSMLRIQDNVSLQSLEWNTVETMVKGWNGMFRDLEFVF